MFYHALTGNNEMPECEWELGKFTSNATKTTKVTLNYKPKKLLIIYPQAPNLSSYRIASIEVYDEEVSRDSFRQLSYDQDTTVALPCADSNKLASIDDDGFTFNSSTPQEYRYVAIK